MGSLREMQNPPANPPAGQPADHAYAYDLGGNRRGEARDAAATAWTTNGRNQLVADAPALRVQADYNAAPAGNRAWLNGREFDLDSVHRLDTVLPMASGEQTLTLRAEDAATGGVLRKSWQVTVPAFAPKIFDYDANGNLTRITQAGVVLRFHKWDARDRLIAWGSGTTVEGRFEYDSLGQRYRETDGAGQLVRQWVWDGGAQPLQERDATGAVTRRFFGQGEMRRIGGSEVARYYARDHLGSVREVVDGNNAVVASYTFDPYGRRAKLAGTEDFEVGFTGHYYHAATGLYLTRFRAYDADTARWLSRDPIAEAGGINLYGYVGNNPILYYDPLGLIRWGQLARGVGQFAGGVIGAVAAGAITPTGIGLPAAVGLALTSGVALTAGVVNIGAAFSDDPNAAALEDMMPDNASGVLGRAIGGEKGQKICGGLENAVTGFKGLTSGAMADDVYDMGKGMVDMYEGQANIGLGTGAYIPDPETGLPRQP